MSGMKAFSPGLFALACVVTAAAAPCPSAGKVELAEQNWDNSTRVAFWFTDQGSRIMPLSWFTNLEIQLGTDAPENFSQRLSCYGLIPDSFEISGDFNKSKLPIGFAVGKKSGTTTDYVGLTCAACHSGVIRNGGRQIMIDGGPSMFDFDTFLGDLVTAMNQTYNSRWKTFADAVTNAKGIPDMGEFKRILDTLDQRSKTSAPSAEAGPAGFGRLDAFGHIFNQVVLALGNVPTKSSNTPSSFPALWDISQHTVVQWNFSAPNAGVGHDAPGALLRNIGEVLGVFGDVTVKRVPKGLLQLPGVAYNRGSLQIENLRNIEEMVSELRSPQWPFKRPSEADIEAGEVIYSGQCAECHAVIDHLNPPVPYPAIKTVLSSVGTDPALSNKIGTETGPSGALQGTPKGLLPGIPLLTTFGKEERVALLAAQMAFDLLPSQSARIGVLAGGSLDAVFSALNPGYKARPLNGVWATAPYLHNGSVPTLRDLLNPPDCKGAVGCTPRPALFCAGPSHAGASQYDIDKVGFAIFPDSVAKNCPDGTSLVDTSKGGSKDVGHLWGTTLTNQEKNQLVAYLKTL